jgi:hypothetical protein
MRLITQRFLATLLLCLLLGLGACGTSGHDVPQYPEVRFQIEPAGGGGVDFRFLLDTLFANDRYQTYLTGTEFAASGPFHIVLENAQPAYGGRFTRGAGSPDLNVTLALVSASSQTSVTDSTLGTKDTASVAIGGSPPGPNDLETSEIRFHVCVPSPDRDACFSDTGSGTPGIPFTGTIGDAISSHQINGTTPSVYFLQNAQDTVNAAITRTGSTGPSLRVELYINGTLKDTETGTGDLIFREDL